LTVAKEDLRERVRQAITDQKRPTVTVLSSLLATQDELGYIPDEAIHEVAALNEASINEVWGVASFYKNFRFTPPGEHTIEICWGPSCHLVGATDIIEKTLEHLGLEAEGETAGNKLTLRFNTCLGACAQAPMISIDHHLRGRMTPEKAVALIDNIDTTGTH
jgi:NADH:ubiquinone oxidoreductase subunit E